MVTKEPPALPNADPLPARYLWNLVALLAAGTAGLAWIVHFTDWLPTIASLLALSGILTWLGVLLRLLPEDRIKQLQQLIDQRILSRPITFWVALASLALVSMLWVSFGTLEIRSVGISDTRGLWVLPKSSSEPEHFLTPQDPLRLHFWTGPFQNRTLEVKAQGHPSQNFFLSWGRRREVRFPESFDRPVALLCPPKDKTIQLPNQGGFLELTVRLTESSSVSIRLESFGHTLWLGTDKDIIFPQKTRTRLAKAAAHENILAWWLAAQSDPRLANLRLSNVDTIEYRWLRKNLEPFPGYEIPHIKTIPPPDPSTDGFISIVELK